jgi:hypothetical protein
MRQAMICLWLVLLLGLFLDLAALLPGQPAARAATMKSTAPEKMLPADEARKMRACDARAMKEKIPMERRTRFVKECMAAMK